MIDKTATQKSNHNIVNLHTTQTVQHDYVNPKPNQESRCKKITVHPRTSFWRARSVYTNKQMKQTDEIKLPEWLSVQRIR